MQEKHRPPQLASTSSYNSLAIARMVSPIVPLMMSEDMRNTYRISQYIRQQQTDLITATILDTKVTDSPAKLAAEASECGNTSSETSKQASGVGSSTSADSSGSTTSANGESVVSVEAAGSASHINVLPARYNPETRSNASPHPESDSANSDPELGGEYDRITSSISRKKLRRDKAPGPLQIPGHANRFPPAINSAPIRTYHPGIPGHNTYNIPTGYPGRTVHAGHGGYGGAGGASGAAGYYQPRRVPMRHYLQPMPYSAVQEVQTPLRRSNPVVYERRLVRPRMKERRKPVQDVFLGDVTKEAPMNSQPPSAQREHFDNHEDDRTDATDEEMREMESKRQAYSRVQGTISFNDESAFNFKIFRGREHDAKAKFIRICETTWDQYMAKLM